MVRHSKGGTIVAVIVVLWALGTVTDSCDDTDSDPTSPVSVINDDTYTDDTFSDGVQDLSLEMVWDDTSASEQAVICDAIDTFGMDWAVDQFQTGSGGKFDDGAVAAFFAGKC